MRIALCTLILNEMEWIEKLYLQHKDWPGLTGWCWAEAADAIYQQTNPEMVSPEGLSVDGSTEFLAELARTDPRVTHVRHGIARHADPAQGKCQARNRYLEEVDGLDPDWVGVVDADEMYPRDTQSHINDLLEQMSSEVNGVMIPQKHIWYPPSVRAVWDFLNPGKEVSCTSLFSQEVGGGYWSVPHCRFWRWRKGMRHVNDHNTPQGGLPIRRPLVDFHCLHMGFAASLVSRRAKHAFYVARGEGKERTGRNRADYVACRSCWETWKPGDALPHGASVIPYRGLIPECFQVQEAEVRHA